MTVDLLNLLDVDYYSDVNRDLVSGGLRTEQQFKDHFINFGISEGRKFSPIINLDLYRTSNADLTELSNEDLFNHLSEHGIAEGRKFSYFYDTSYYRNQSPDLSNDLNFNNEQLFEHFLNIGLNEGRRFSAFVDIQFYKIYNLDLSTIFSDDLLNNEELLNHLARFGVAEGRRFSISYDPGFYQGTYSDLRSLSNTQLFEHFYNNGVSEKRASSDHLNVDYYLANQADLRAFNITPLQALEHFEAYGFFEGRSASNYGLVKDTDPGTRGPNALNLGVLSETRQGSISDSIGPNDSSDSYRFTLATNSMINIEVLGANGSRFLGSVNLWWDKEGDGTFPASALDTFGSDRALGRGTYFLDISAFSQSPQLPYTVNFSVTPFKESLTVDPGNTDRTAFNLGLISSSSAVWEYVGVSDDVDIYRFDLIRQRNVNFTIDGNDVTIGRTIYADANNDGQRDDRAIRGSSRDFTVLLDEGTYFLELERATNSSRRGTNYRLVIIPR
jgi:hypothetical protein